MLLRQKPSMQQPGNYKRKNMDCYANNTMMMIKKLKVNLLIAHQSSKENGWTWRKRTAEPIPATLTRLCSAEEWSLLLVCEEGSLLDEK